MPVIRESMSLSTLADLLGVEPWRLIAIEIDLRASAVLVLEGEDRQPSDQHKVWKAA